MHTHGTTIILSLVMRTLFLPILIMPKDFKLKRFVKASALTFRAYAFEKLVHYYCWRWQDSNNGASQGLVLRIDESTGGQGYATLAETYAQIYKDLDEAIALYNQSGMDRDAAQVWMPNVNVAHAVYARAAITKQDYTKALSEAKLARQNYPLMSNAEYQSGFCNPTSEWISVVSAVRKKIIGIGVMVLSLLVTDIMRVQTILVLGPLGVSLLTASRTMMSAKRCS